MVTTLKIDFVSDVVCPWCAIGLAGLDEALANLSGKVVADVHFKPFELNPQMGPEGQDIGEHLGQKYGMAPEQTAQNREAIRERGADAGFTFNMNARQRIYNTFDAHRLLCWAETEGKQVPLKHALLKAYFTDGQNPSDHDVLVMLSESVGLDADKARRILDSDSFAATVREEEQFYMEQGINGVPAVIINDRHLIQGGQPAAVFESALLKIAQEAA